MTVARTAPRLAALLCAAALLAVAAPAAEAARKASDAPTAGTHRKKTAKPKVQRSPSDESTAERDRRLLRECKGRPNAGACLGFAS